MASVNLGLRGCPLASNLLCRARLRGILTSPIACERSRTFVTERPELVEMSKIKRWDEWDVPPLWVWAVGGLVLILISTVIFSKIGESLGSGSTAAALPPTGATGTGGTVVAHD